ncbi:glycosyltransferase family 2 protein [Neotabrizicola sp. sgz301269]|uniref:glycosyltransferase family 2 protein n=1 Tax=Neotabrizicola sp. sgz301269 TaxID=3276282 RepID=UPI00376FDB8C
MLQYDEILTTSGIRVPFVPSIITPKIERPMRNNRYEGGECASLRRLLRPGDRVLELGSGVGLLSTVAGLIPGIESVTTIEANPDLIPLIRETHRLNGISNVDLRNGVATAEDGPEIDFYLRPDFWASSMEPDSRAYSRKVSLRRWGLKELIAEVNPTVIVSDIEGGEMGLFDGADLSGVRAMVVEFHPKVYGEDGLARILATLAARGLTLAAENKAESTVQLLERATPPVALPFPPRDFRSWPIAEPRVFVATCMKDEGPFLLEWLAWHKAMGVTNITVFTNDCSDGTDLLLDRLADLGHVQHLPNPALLQQSPALQPIALAYAHHLPAMRQADIFISMDVDEFLNVRVGDQTLNALFAATGAFDVISVSEVNHGCNGHEHFMPGWMTELFPGHQTLTPGKFKSRRGVKSIVRLSEKVEKLRNHRPDMRTDLGPLRWLDGAGRPTGHFMADRGENGHDCRGSYGLVRLEHFPLRSLDSYLAKMYRGDVVVTGKQVSRTYWRQRNRMEEISNGYDAQLKRAKVWHKTHLAKDKILMGLHEAACAAHAARIAALVQEPSFKERRDWALREAWVTGEEAAAAAE